jgi:protein-S-isoprenylcysteine O-methyltransferase Ste14
VNVYRFKIELSAWFAKTVLAVLSTVVFLQLFADSSSTRSYPVSLRLVAEHEWLIVSTVLAVTGFVWFCYWKVFRILRTDKRYGARH